RAGRAVRRRSAADLAPGPHGGIKIARFLARHEPHRSLLEPALLEEGVVCGGNDIDDGIADRHDVEPGGSHALVASRAGRAWSTAVAPANRLSLPGASSSRLRPRSFRHECTRKMR